MKKLLKKIQNEVKATIAEFAPFAVINSACGKTHYCWSYKAALEWLACYDAGNFGTTWVFNFFDKPIACKA